MNQRFSGKGTPTLRPLMSSVSLTHLILLIFGFSSLNCKSQQFDGISIGGSQYGLLKGISSTADQTASIISFLERPLTISSYSTDKPINPDTLAEFASIPKPTIPFTATKQSIDASFQSLIEDIEFGELKLGDEQRESLSAARQILFDPPNSEKRTAGYEKFFKLTEELAKWEARLKEGDNDAEKLLANQKIQEANDLLATWPKAQQIAAAIDIVRSLSPLSKTQSKEVISSELSSLTKVFVPDLMNKIDDASGWTTVSSTGNANFQLPAEVISSPFGKTLAISKEGRTTELASPNIEGWTFAFKIYGTPWADLPESLRNQNNWRLKSGRKVSDGKLSINNEGTAGSLIPQVVTGLLIVRNVSVWFSENSAKEIISLLEKGNTIRLGGISFSSETSFYTRRSLHLNFPQITMASIGSYPLAPTPKPNLTW